MWAEADERAQRNALALAGAWGWARAEAQSMNAGLARAVSTSLMEPPKAVQENI